MAMADDTVRQCPLCGTGLVDPKEADAYHAANVELVMLRKIQRHDHWGSIVEMITRWWTNNGFDSLVITAIAAVIIVIVMSTRSCVEQEDALRAEHPEAFWNTPMQMIDVCNTSANKANDTSCACLRGVKVTLIERGSCGPEGRGQTCVEMDGLIASCEKGR